MFDVVCVMTDGLGITEKYYIYDLIKRNEAYQFVLIVQQIICCNLFTTVHI